MIVVLIVGILSAVGVPAYNEYVYRAKLSEGYLLIDSTTKGQTSFYLEHKFFLNLITDVNGRNAAPTGGNKYQVTSMDPEWKSLGSSLIIGDATYFHLVSTAGYWDASGTQQTDLIEDGTGKMYAQSADLGVNDKACNNSVTGSQIGITNRPNQRVVTTWATAAFKTPTGLDGLTCTILWQTLFAEGDKISKTAVLSLLE